MTGHHDTKPGEKTRQTDKTFEEHESVLDSPEHESVLDSPEHIEGVKKSPTQHQKQKGGEACDSVLSGPECIEPENKKKANSGKYG